MGSNKWKILVNDSFQKFAPQNQLLNDILRWVFLILEEWWNQNVIGELDFNRCPVCVLIKTNITTFSSQQTHKIWDYYKH